MKQELPRFVIPSVAFDALVLSAHRLFGLLLVLDLLLLVVGKGEGVSPGGGR